MTTLSNETVTITSRYVRHAAGCLEEQMLDVVSDLHCEIEGGVCVASVSAEHSSERLNEAIGRVTELRRWLELLQYGHADEPVEVPLGVLFPLDPKRGES